MLGEMKERKRKVRYLNSEREKKKEMKTGKSSSTAQMGNGMKI